MSSRKRLSKVVCPNGHTLAEIFPSPDGPTLTVLHMAVGVSPRPGESVRVDREGESLTVALSTADYLDASCALCGTDHFIKPDALLSAVTSGTRRVVAPKWA